MRVRGKDYPISDAAMTDAARQSKAKGSSWRIGFVKTHTWDAAPQYAKDAIESFIKKLSLEKDISIVDAALPEGMERTHEVHQTIYDKSLAYYFKGEHKQSDFVSPVMNQIIVRGNAIPVDSFKEALATQTALIYEMDAYMNDFDVLISLSTAGEAPLREVTETPDPALMWTLMHLPVVSVPQFTSPDGLPFGMQIVARKYNDHLLFEFLDYMRAKTLIPIKGGFFSQKTKSLNI